MNKTKQCTNCKEIKSLDDFYNGGIQMGRCKICFGLYAKARQAKYRLENNITPNYFLTDEDKSMILKEYCENKLSLHKIERKYGFGHKQIANFLVKQGIEIERLNCQRKHKIINESYFDIIDSEDKAYFLGLLWADGCNYRKVAKGKNAHQVVINLQERDKHILETLTSKIFENNSVLRFINKQNGKDGCIRQNQWGLRIPNKHISDTLLDKGMTPHKSLTVEWPKGLPENLIVHFIRGVYDGDGGIAFNSNSKNYIIGIVGSVKFIKKLHNICNNLLNYKFCLCTRRRKSGVEVSDLKIHGNFKCKMFLDWLYKDATMKLNRKFALYQDLCKMIKGRQTH